MVSGVKFAILSWTRRKICKSAQIFDAKAIIAFK